jgi:hypothetical protein
MEEFFQRRRDSPLTDHAGPGVQSDGAFSGQVPPKSLSTFGVRRVERRAGSGNSPAHNQVYGTVCALMQYTD